jgi:hypothetical protein
VNNFACPQPFLKPDVFNSVNFPRMNAGSSSVDSNRLSADGNPFSMCGFDLTSAKTLLSYFPLIYDNMTVDVGSNIVIGPSSSVFLMRIDGFRHSFFFPNDPTATNFFLDSISVSTFASSKRDRSNAHAIYPVRKYTSVVQDPTNPNKWRLSTALNGTRNIFETEWEFKPPNEVKYSYILREWDWAAPDHDAAQLTIQSTTFGEFYRGKPGSYCWLPGPNDTLVMSGTVTEPIVECLSGADFMNVTINNYAILINQSANFGGITVDFPLIYQYDTLYDVFSVNNPSAYASLTLCNSAVPFSYYLLLTGSCTRLGALLPSIS